jgi:transcription elongation factor Elf1
MLRKLTLLYHYGINVVIMGYNKTKNKILSRLWDNKSNREFVCPECSGHLIIVQLEPMDDYDNPYTPYKTVVECTNCSFSSHAISYTILGSLQSYDLEHVTLAAWSPSGNRIIKTFDHLLDYDLLKECKSSKELVEFLIVDDYIVQII